MSTFLEKMNLADKVEKIEPIKSELSDFVVAKIIKSEKHPNAIGLSVPGMPLGSPGMEVEGMFTPYDVLILFKDGTSKVYAEVRKQ